jgi:ribose transport system substrate-binding protein
MLRSAVRLILALAATSLLAVGTAQTVRIGYAPPVYDVLDYFGQFAAGFEARMDDLGVEHEFIARASTQEANMQQQLDIVEDFITLGVDYIIVGPIDYFGIVPALRAANEAGIPIIVINHLDVHPEDTGVDVMAYSGYSHAEGGRITAEWALENVLEPGDQVGLMFAEPGNQISEERVGTARDIWVEAGIQIAFEQYAYWEQARAYDATERQILAYPDVVAIYGGNSAMAMGTAEALDAMGIEDVDVFGFGAVPPELDMIWEGLIRGSIFRDSQSSGRYIAEAIHADLNGEPVQKQYPLDMVMVSSREDILTKVPVEALELMENWPEVQAELEARGD